MYSILPEKQLLINSIMEDKISETDVISDTTQTIDINHIMEYEAELSTELHDMKRLEVLSSLIHEFNTNLDLLEFENCYYSLQNLRKKMNENGEAFIKQSFRFQRSVATYVDSLHLKLIDTIYQIVSEGFWNIRPNTIKFSPIIQWGRENVDLEYSSILDMLNQLYFQNNTIDPSLWIITKMELGDSMEKVRSHLNTLLQNYINLQEITNYIKDAIFSSDIKIEYIESENRLNFIRERNLVTIEDILFSFKSLNDFLLKSFPENSLGLLLTSLGHLLENELTKCVKTQASIILGNGNSLLKEQVQNINEQLVSISKKPQIQWHYTGESISQLLNDQQLYTNLLIDKVFHEQVISIRNIFKNDSQQWKKTRTLQLSNINKPSVNTEARQISVSKSELQPNQVEEADDDWGWDAEISVNDTKEDAKADDEAVEEAEDAWGAEIDIDLNLQSPKKLSSMKSLTKPRGTSNTESTQKEDNDEGWDEAWDIGEDVDDLNKQENDSTSLNSQNIASGNNANVEVSQLPSLFTKIMQNFKSESEKIDADIVNHHYYNYKLNLLQTTFFAISVAHSTSEWWNFYIDMRELNEQGKSTHRIHELADRYLENNRLTKQIVVLRLVQEQLYQFYEKENTASWSSTLEELIPFVNKEILKPLTYIKGKEAEKELLRFLDFLYNNCVTNVILQWDIISEKNSENLGELISLISSNTEISMLEHSAAYREIRAKFELIGQFLPLHLKEIMDLFYNGDFYLFSTEEIVQWINLLFADTPIRRDAVEDIKEIRQAALEDN